MQVFYLGLERQYQFPLGDLQEGPLNWIPFGAPFYEESPPALNHTVKSWIFELPNQYRGLHSDMFLTEMQGLLYWMLQIDLEDRPRATDVRRGLHRLHKIATGRILESVNSVPITSLPTRSTRPSIVSIGTTRSPNRQPVYGLSVANLVNNIKSGSLEDVEECLRLQPDVEGLHENDRPLIHAIERKEKPFLRAPIIKALLEHKSDLDVRTRSFENETPLFLAVSKGDVDMVRILHDALIKNKCGFYLDVFSQDGKTPLMEAARLNHVAVVSELLKRGADTTICMGQYQHNCLHFAVMNIESDEDLLKAFVGQMDFNLCPIGIVGYETPMMQHIKLGVRQKYGEKVNAKWERKFNMLLRGKGDVNMRYPQKSPLQLAIEEDKVDIVRILLKADAKLPDKENGTSREMKKLITQTRNEIKAASKTRR